MKTIQVTLFMGEDQEILGDFATYAEALSTAQEALDEVVPGKNAVPGKHQNGSLISLDENAHQRIRVPGEEYSVLLQVMEIEDAVTAQIDQTLEGVEEEPVELVKAGDGYHVNKLVDSPSLVEVEPKKASKKTASKKPVLEPTFVEETPKEKPKKVVAKNPPAISVGEHKFWGCDQQKVLAYVESHHSKVLETGLELRRHNGKWALSSGKDVIWTTGYSDVAEYALQMAKEHAKDFSVLA
jgi:hypothetical protein